MKRIISKEWVIFKKFIFYSSILALIGFIGLFFYKERIDIELRSLLTIIWMILSTAAFILIIIFIYAIRKDYHEKLK